VKLDVAKRRSWSKDSVRKRKMEMDSRVDPSGRTVCRSAGNRKGCGPKGRNVERNVDSTCFLDARQPVARRNDDLLRIGIPAQRAAAFRMGHRD
jgi:hypothetical protein